MSHVMNTYARQPVAFVRGQGVWLWDEAGKKYLYRVTAVGTNGLESDQSAPAEITAQ
jgi:acetylornithine/N-succinyldiaminopimelate aminotransferase